MNTNETHLQAINNTGILRKIIQFFKNIFASKKEDNYIKIENSHEHNTPNDNNFLKTIKIDKDPDVAMLLKIQDELEKRGINGKNAFELTKDLTDIQKEKLENLYKEQIEAYENSIENYKNRIVAIRKRLA